MQDWQRFIHIKEKNPLPFYKKSSNLQSSDEKGQQNRFLTEWLESIFIAGVASKDSISEIIKND